MQDMSKYLDLFKEEAGEMLQLLNTSLLALEEDPGQKEAIEEVFRAAHSLKGMAATMGFDVIANLTHKMENLMDKVRKKEFEVSTPLMDILFKSSDAVQLLLEQVDADSDAGGIDLDSVIDQLEKAANGELGPCPQLPSEDSPTPAVSPEESPDIERLMEKPSSHARSKKAAPSDSPLEKPLAPHPPSEKGGQGGFPEQKKPAKPAPMKTVRVKLEHLDNLMNLVGELVICKARLDELETCSAVPELDEALDRIKTILGDLRHEVMQVRMVPVGQIFNRFPRMVRDLAHELGKEIDFIVEGSEIELDRTILDEIGDPIVHLLRNAIGHGIEAPADREEKGKPRTGTIRLAAAREKEGVVIEVSDDGGGIDAERIAEIAVQKGFVSRKEAETLDDDEIIQLICLPGLTSSKETTSLSGRGVGVDAVKAKIESLGGRLSVESEVGNSTRFVLALPPSLAIIKTLLVKVGAETYAIPLKHVVEVIEAERSELKSIRGEKVVMIHGQVLPLVYLDRILSNSSNGKNSKGAHPIVIVESDGKRKGLAVNDILSEQDSVIKPVGKVLQSIKHFAGATILGNGKVAFILDVMNLIAATVKQKEKVNEVLKS